MAVHAQQGVWLFVYDDQPTICCSVRNALEMTDVRASTDREGQHADVFALV